MSCSGGKHESFTLKTPEKQGIWCICLWWHHIRQLIRVFKGKESNYSTEGFYLCRAQLQKNILVVRALHSFQKSAIKIYSSSLCSGSIFQKFLFFHLIDPHRQEAFLARFFLQWIFDFCNLVMECFTLLFTTFYVMLLYVFKGKKLYRLFTLTSYEP